MKKILFIIGLLFSFNVKAANITASVNKSIIPQGDLFILTLTADDNINEKPDFSVLDTDYNVYSTSVSRSSYVINAKTSSTTKWQTMLAAKKEGKQTIPSIKVGKDFSNEIEIEVLPEGTEGVASADTEPSYSIRTEIEDKKMPYVQEMINYNVIISDIGGLQGSEPVFDNSDEWIIKKLGQPDVVSGYINGKNVREIIFKYALFAQKSGKLVIPAVRFDGYTLSNNAGGIFAGNMLGLNIGFPSNIGFNMPINLVSPAKNIEVLPVPTGYKGQWWLPAKDVELKANYTDNTEFIEGEAFSREIELKVVGVTDTQLPEIRFENAEHLKQYPQKRTVFGELVNGEPVAIQKVVNVYIPQTVGEIVLPAIKVEWFNVQKQKLEVAEIQPQKIMVKPNPNMKTILSEKENNNQKNISENIQSVDERKIRLEHVISFGVVFFIFGMLLGYHIFRCRYNKNIKPQCEQRKYPDFIIKKAYAKDYRALRDALISWGIAFYYNNNITTLNDVAKASNSADFAKQIDILVAKLYNPNDDQNWNADAFVESYKKIMKKKEHTKKNTTPLPKLYE